MSTFQSTLKRFSNKYLIVTIVFLLFMLFLDTRNVFNQYSRYKEMKSLEKAHRDLTTANKERREDGEQLRSNPIEIERVAREKYYMKRDNETIFLFPQ
jgi:cell division protein DivIC